MTYQETSIRISATVKKSGSKPTMQMQIIRFIIAVLGCYGSTFIFLTGYGLDVNKLLVFTVILGCCFLTGAYSLKKSIAYLTFAFTSVSCILASFMLKEEYSAGVAGIINKYMSLTDPDYKKVPYITLLEPELADKHITIFIVLTVVFLCLAVGMLFNYSNSGFYTAILLTVVTLPVFILGLEPSFIAFAAFVISVTALIVFEFTASNSVTGQQFFRYGIQCAAAALLIAFVCICIVFGFVKITDYERSDKINELFKKADNYIDSGEFHNDVMTKLYLGNEFAFYGAINHGKLDEFGDIRFKFIDVLQVTMPRSADTVYLRGFVGSVYTGRSWEELPDGKLHELEKITDGFNTNGLSPLLFDSYNLKNAPTILPNYSFTVKNIAANDDYMYLPYNLVPESVSRYTIVDHSYFKGDSSTYFGQVYNPDSYHGYQNLFRKRWSIPSTLVADEAAYRNFVYENYLELPESFSTEEMFNQNYYEYITAEEIQTGKSTLDEMTVFSRKLYYIKEWLRDNCTYSLTTEPLARGEDFVNHFLEHKEGSCSHFASTAVLMCRYAGIPARYVEGYIITPYDVESDAPMGSTVTVNVKDSHGHAWVEVYIDGYGWYPMEFTSGYGNVRTAFPTETTVTETEPVTESEPEADETTVVQNEDGTDATTNITVTAPQPQEAVTAVPDNQDNAEATVTTVPSENTEATPSQDNENDNSRSIGFGIFGIEGDKKVDVVYDLTWLVVVVLVIIAIPAMVIIRRMIILSRYRSAANPASQVSADYRRFCKLLKIMDMPEQGGMGYSEYADELAKRSPFLAEDNASRIIGFALKASFGGDSISRDEAHEMRTEVTSLIKRYYRSLSSFGKFRVKFIYCIL